MVQQWPPSKASVRRWKGVASRVDMDDYPSLASSSSQSHMGFLVPKPAPKVTCMRRERGGQRERFKGLGLRLHLLLVLLATILGRCVPSYSTTLQLCTTQSMPPATTTAARAFNASRSCFSTTPVPYKQLRQGPTPEFNYRKPSFVGGVPVVEYTKDANEADEMLETLRAT